MLINKTNFFYRYLISSFYLSLIIPFVGGFLDLYFSPLFRKVFTAISQSYIYLLPIVFVLFVRARFPKFIFVLILYLYLFIFLPFTEFFTVKDFLFGMKNYFLVLLYIPIMYHLMLNDENFKNKFEKHIRFVFLLAAGIFFFEYSGNSYPHPAFVFFRELSGGIYPVIGKPNGIDLGIHLQGFIFGMGIFYYLVNQKYFFAGFFFLALILSTVKTWILAFLITLCLHVLSSKSFKKILYAFVTLSVLLAIFIVIDPGEPSLVDHYLYSFNPKSYGTGVLLSQLIDAKELFSHSIIPNGLIYNQGSYYLPSFIKGSEIFLYTFLYQIGFIGLALYCLSIYSGLFIKENKYRIIIFLSGFSMLHTFALARAYVFIIVLYFSSYYILEQKSKKLQGVKNE